MESFTVRDVLKWRAGEYFLPVPGNTSVKDAITILFNLHRVPLVDPETNQLNGMLSQVCVYVCVYMYACGWLCMCTNVCGVCVRMCE
jgi:hypothetical protein